MSESKLKKNLCAKIDKFCEGIDVKLFGQPVEDFDLEEMSEDQLKNIKRISKIKKIYKVFTK